MRASMKISKILRALPAAVLAGGAVMILTAAATGQTNAQDKTSGTRAKTTETMTAKATRAGAKTATGELSAAAARQSDLVHRSAIVIDTHADTPQRFLDDQYDLGDALKGGEFNLESAKKGGLGAEFFSIWVDPARYKGHDARRTLELIDAVKLQVAKHPK